jgi:hypothetical protein
MGKTLIISAGALFLALGGIIPTVAEDAVQAPGGNEQAPSATPSELASIAEQYEQQIARLESDYGPYDARLGEQLQSQARVYQQMQDYGRAVDALKRSFHIKRVNDGLQDLGQVPLLLSIIESQIALGNWKEVDQDYDQLLWIYRRNYAEGEMDLLNVYNQVGRWKLQAYRDGLLENVSYRTVSDAAWLYSRSINLTEQRFGENDPRLIELHYGHALASYQAMIEYAKRPLDDYIERQGMSTITYMQRCYPVRTGTGRVVTQCVVVPVTNLGTYTRAQDERDIDVERRFLAARKSLERIVAIHDAHPELSPESRAEALIHAGDWYILRGSTETALTKYEEAWRLLQGTSGGDRKLEMFFGEPVSVPSLRLSLPNIDRRVASTGEASGEYIAVSYDVSKTGRVLNAKIAEITPGAATASRRKALDSIRGKRFRPRFENGVAVDTVGTVKRFPVN